MATRPFQFAGMEERHTSESELLRFVRDLDRSGSDL